MNSIYRKRVLVKALRVFLLCIILLLLFVIWFGYKELSNCKKEATELQEQLDSYKKEIFVASVDITGGEIITGENVRKEVRYTDESLETYISEDDFGKAVITDVAVGTCLSNGIVKSINSSVREVFISEIEMTEYLEQGCRIDIRINYPNAEDYVVLLDKTLVSYEPGVGMVLRLTEEEILFLSSAIFDSSTYVNTKIYAVKYPNQEHMDSGVVNYVPNREILAMLGRENTEGESRTALEQRLKLMIK